MSDDDLRRQLAEAQETIRALQEDLAETNTGFIALTLEFEQRVDERMAELQEANRRLEQEIADRKRAEEALREHREHLEELVAERTAELRKMVNLMAGREVRMAELKGVIRQLRAQLEEAGLTPVADDPLLGGESTLST